MFFFNLNYDSKENKKSKFDLWYTSICVVWLKTLSERQKKLATLWSHDFTLYRNSFLYDGSDGETHNTLCFFLFGDDVNQQLKQCELKFSKYYFDKKNQLLCP